MKQLYIIAGPNGAGKTVASYTILPEIFKCKEFVNADEIARGISPFNSDKIGIKAGRLLLARIKELLQEDETFAVETTLATRSYVNLIHKAKSKGYEVILLFLTLNSKELAVKRVQTRVNEGGHNIKLEVIKRRYKSGINNLFDIYLPIVNRWIVVDNSGEEFQIIAQGDESEIIVKNESTWSKIKAIEYGD
ncbi:MAG: zeta toxin [Bacteroidales bacterium]|nr:zeta toxin [Bacteroidales bacterium]